ncbi:MAG: ATPase, T2SS/T4P/T4SS family [Candidatus Sumerlaeia bacterium]|nr:ATPase, T2SS/T4P/T4SS family [Candidatus Sumerlaeia bacterium]
MKTKTMGGWLALAVVLDAVAGGHARIAAADTIIVWTERGTTTSVEGEFTSGPTGGLLRLSGATGAMEIPLDPARVVRIIRKATPAATPSAAKATPSASPAPGAIGEQPPLGTRPLPTPPVGVPTTPRPLATPPPNMSVMPYPTATPMSGVTPAIGTPLPAPTAAPAIVPPTTTPPPLAPRPPVPSPARSLTPASIAERLAKQDWTVFSDLLDRALSEDVLPFLIGIPLFIVVFWAIPNKLLYALARRGDVGASIWVLRVKWLGIFALLGYLAGKIRVPRRTKSRCPICNKAIDDPDEYADFNFYVCPHCGENITPVYDLNSYMQHLIGQLDREVHQRRAKRPELVTEKDATTKLVRAIITQAIRSRASDIHIDTSAEGAIVRQRVDGVLLDMLALPKSVVPSVVSAIKVMAKLDIAERRIPQDGKFSTWVDRNDIDVRVNTSPAMHGEKVSMRLLDKRAITVGPAGLGLEGQNLALFDQAIHRPHGMLIVTGPAGSGKSTTLYVALNVINTGEKNIITLEDPIEYEMKGLTQMQVNPAVNFTFATGLRTIVRQDPNVIMVGEIRDKETAEMAIESAITGHLLMTTMHTIDTTTVFTRLTDMGIDSRRYASALALIVAQRLVRVNCGECRRPYAPDPRQLEQLHLLQSAKDIVFLKGYGCARCLETGYYGRTGLFEILAPDREIIAMLEQNLPASRIREAVRRKGMRNIREEGVLKVMRGQTTIEEVIRATT